MSFYPKVCSPLILSIYNLCPYNSILDLLDLSFDGCHPYVVGGTLSSMYGQTWHCSFQKAFTNDDCEATTSSYFGLAHAPLLSQRHSNLCILYVIIICAYLFVCLVTREHFGLAHAPLLSQRHSNLRILYVIVICAYLFVCLVTRERFGLAHAPLLSQRHSNLRVLRVSVNLACVFVRLVARERSGLPMHLSFHKGVRNCVSRV